jgi:lipid-A-disaccharide synthase
MVRALGARATARLVLAEGLPAEAATWIAERARDAGVRLVRDPIATLARDVDVAVVASGTATLETVALGLPTVIVYRTDPLTYAVAKRWVRVPHIGLPNLVLGRAAFPELVQTAVTPERLVREVLAAVPERETYIAACREVRSRLLAGLDDRAPAERVAEMLSPWLR